MNHIINMDYEIAVIGAGPASLSFLKNIDNEDVVLIERQKIPRNKPCGGMLHNKTVSFLSHIPEGVLSKPSKLDVIYFDFDNQIEVYEERGFLNANRQKFDYWLLKSIKKSFDFMPASTLVSIREYSGYYKLKVINNNKTIFIKAKYLIGADGANSMTREFITKPLERYFAFQAWVNTDVELKDMYFIISKKLLPFYAWVIPKGNQKIIGFACNEARHYRNIFNSLFDKIKPHNGFENIIIKKQESYPLAKGRPEDVFLGKGSVFLVGEAAGLISPSTGEGISFALRSGKMCADAFNNNEPENYFKSASVLIDEIRDKWEELKVLRDAEKRREFFENARQVEPLI